MGPPPRSFPTGQARGLKAHADAHDCIMVRIHIGSTEYKCVAQGSAPDGELPSDRYADTYKATSEAGARRKARLAVHRPCACSGVKACPGEGRGRCETQASLRRHAAKRR